MRFQYSHTIRLTPGEPEWRALQDAVDAAKPPPPSAPTRGRIGSKEPQPAAGKMNMYFVVVDSSSNADLGEASYDLSPLLQPTAREASALQSIVAKDRTGASVGTPSIRVKAFDAIKLVQEAAPPGRDGRHGQDDRYGPRDCAAARASRVVRSRSRRPSTARPSSSRSSRQRRTCSRTAACASRRRCRRAPFTSISAASTRSPR